MSTPKASPHNRYRDAKSSTRPGGAGLGEVVPSMPSGAATTARGSGGMPLAYQPIVNLHSLKELLRPSAASRIAAVARVVHLTYDHSAVPNADGGKQHPCANTHGVFDLSPSSVLNAAPATSTRPPPSSLVEVTVATPPNIHSLTPKNLDTSVLDSGTSPVPPLPLVVECATQLDKMLAQCRTRNEGERCFLSKPPPSPLPPKECSSVDQGNQNDAVPRAAPVRGSLSGGSPSMSRTEPGGDGSATALPSVRSCARHMQRMMGLLLWYCLSTTEDSRLAAGNRSRGVSGFATPARSGAPLAGAGTILNQAQLGGGRTPSDCRKARSGRPGSAWLTGGSLGSGGRSGTCSADPLSAHDWLGSRMSSTASTAGAPSITISDDELADRLFRLAVDAVVLLQGPSIPSAASSPFLPSSCVHISDQVTRMGSDSGSDPVPGAKGGPVQSPTEEVTDDADTTAIELQTSSLWTLAAVLVRFADAPLSVTGFLPVLFPQVDMRLPVGAAVRHPLLQPLLRGDPRHVSLQCSAASALTTLLQRLRPTLQYAEEPQQSRPTAFLSLAAQCGTMLASLHEGLCWGLGQQCEHAQSAASDTTILTSSLATALPILDAYATVVAVTPYHRCPHSHAVVLQTLQLPVMRFFLSHDDAAAFAPATQLVSNLLKNDSVRGTATNILGGVETQVGEQGHSKVSQAQVPGGDCAAADAAAAAAATVLPALLSHADTRVEVWSCMVPLSRLYPRLVQCEFDALMTPSVSLVSTLTEWEASEKIADAAVLAAASSVAVLEGDATPHTEGPAGTLSSPAQYTVGGGGGSGSAEKSGVSPPTHRQMRHDGSEAVVVSSPSQRSRSPTALLDAFAECLRTWLHYMGYVWRAFDDNASDPAQRLEGFSTRATLEHKRRIHEELLRPAMRLRRCGDDVRTMTLRCIAQIGNEYVSTLVDRSFCEELVGYAQSSLADAQPRVRGEALTTLGVWLWQYTSLDDFACVTIDSAVHSLTTDPNHVVRSKAAFALSNVTARLPEGSCAVVRDSPDYIATLCATAMHAAVIDTEGGVQGHGIRMMNHLLQVLTLDELISEAIGFEEGVAEGFLRVLLECLCASTRGSPIASKENGTSAGVVRYAVPREAKHRWNAACALGMGLARREVFEAEPKYAVEAVEALCTAVVHDHIFKVRTQAAGALGRIPGHCLSGAYSVKDLTPVVVGSLCHALQTASSTENFRQYKEQGTLHAALRAALAVMITSAVPSNDLEKVFTSYTKLLQKEALL